MSKVMKKNLLLLFNRVNYIELKHTIRIMKITTVLTLIAIFQLSAASLHSQNAKVSISRNNMPLKEFIHEIEKQTDYLFMYSEKEIDLQEQVNVNAKNKSVSKVLKEVFDNSKIEYNFNEGYISLRTKSKEVDQEKRITGIVKDANNEPIIGASILVKGTTTGIVTDIDGRFSLIVPTNGEITVSYIGYLTQNISVKGKNSFLIVMRENSELLDEVIVVGYGSSTKRDLIASVSTVKTEQLSNIPVANISQGLAGRSPGVIVQASGGGINNKPSISIRGGDDPIYVIDGVIRSSADFQSLSPDDIEGMSILKDASATAVYGARATNGIIQVTTKKGKEGKATVEYDFNYSWAQPSNWPKQMDSWTRAEYGNIARENDGLDPVYSDDAIQAMKDGSDPLNYNNTNWRKLVLNNWAPQSKHTVRFTGGTENNNYYASLSHLDQNSLYKNDNHWMKRTNFRLAQTTFIKPVNLQINASIDGYIETTTHPYSFSSGGNYRDVFSHINDKSPLLPGVNKYGLPYNITDNPVADTAEDTGYKRNKTRVANGRGELIWTCPWIDGLKIRGASNYRFYSELFKHWRKDAAQYDWDSQEAKYAAMPQLYKEDGTGYAFTNQIFMEYNNTFGKHTVSALGGFEQYYQKSSQDWVSRENYEFDIDQIEVGPAGTMKNGGSEAEMGRAAWIGQIKYNYENKYYAEGSIRYDGSDYFAPGHRWGAFFSGSLGWVVTEEYFMKPLVERNILNSLKLRASYGETGIDSSAGRFAYLTSYSMNTQGYIVDGEFVSTFSEGALPSPNLTWYTTRQTDFGFDFASLNNRLYGSFDYFYYSTKGYLIAPTGTGYINTALGISMPKVKSNSEHRRAGYELQFGWRDNIGDLNYDVAANFTYFDQMWALDESESESSYMNPYQRSQQQKGYYDLLLHNLGYYVSAEDVYNSASDLSAFNSGYLTAGDIKYEDTNGDGQITDADKRRLGKSSFPRGQFGLNINLNYKGFYLNALFQGSTQFNMYISGAAAMQTGQSSSMPIIYEYQTDFWTPANVHAQYPRLMSSTSLNSNNNYFNSDFWLINGAYLRMKDFQFGYDLKYSLLKNIGWLSKAKVGLSGQNIFTISKASKYGLDPENSSTAGYGYPIERVLAITVNLGF